MGKIAQCFVGMKSRKRFSCAYENIDSKEFIEKKPTILNFFHILSLRYTVRAKVRTVYHFL